MLCRHVGLDREKNQCGKKDCGRGHNNRSNQFDYGWLSLTGPLAIGACLPR
jgi:hypothetical protein